MQTVASEQRHSLELEHRGTQHVHTYQPRCDCGWRGIPGRKPFAESQYRAHVASCDRLARARGRRRGGQPPQPRPVTPRHLLPDELR